MMTTPPKRKVIRKGASDLRSSALARGGQPPHKTHMRLVCLETERFRRQQERDAYLARAERCAERCAAIDAEVRTLMAQLETARSDEDAPASVKPLRRDGSPAGQRGQGESIMHTY